MLVILDSNILCRDFYMRGTQSQMLLQFGHIVIPEIVYDEVLNKHREKLIEYKNNLTNNHAKYNSLLSEPWELDINIDLEEEQEQYEDFLIQLMLDNDFYPPEAYPRVSHKDIVARSLQRKKPFKSDGRTGYRDYLVWRTVLEIVAHSVEDIHFISENTADFADEQDRNKLHPDLLDEMKSLGIDESKLKYWATLKDFNKEVVKPVLKRLDEEKNIIAQLAHEQENFMIPVSDYVIITLKGFDVSEKVLFVPGKIPLITDMVPLVENIINGISRIDDGKILVEVSSYLSSTVESHATKAEVAAMPQIALEDSTITDLDAMSVAIHTDIPLNVDVEVIYDIKHHKICSIEVVEVSDSRCYAYCPYDWL